MKHSENIWNYLLFSCTTSVHDMRMNKFIIIFYLLDNQHDHCFIMWICLFIWNLYVMEDLKNNKSIVIISLFFQCSVQLNLIRSRKKTFFKFLNIQYDKKNSSWGLGKWFSKDGSDLSWVNFYQSSMQESKMTYLLTC